MTDFIPSGSGTSQPDDPVATSATVHFRDIIPKADHPRIAGISSHNALSWCASRRQLEAPAWLINRLEKQNLESYRGFTATGVVEENVYQYAEDEGAPTEDVAAKVRNLLELLSPEQKASVECGDVRGDDFRLWSNPELYVNPGGLRLEEVTAALQDSIHQILKAALSEEGYEKTRGCCLTNHFLGQLVNGLGVLNEHSYNFRLFSPSVYTTSPNTRNHEAFTTGNSAVLDLPWGFTFFGHHLCLSVVFLGRRMVIGPTFMGAEPDIIDEGPHAGLRLFEDEELSALRLMQSLSADLQDRATISEKMDGASLPKGRWNPFDERHLGGARQDNRTVPYEGVPVTDLPDEARDTITQLFLAFNAYYPPKVLSYRLANFAAHIDKTYFAWIGGHQNDDPFYYRIHSPVAWMELDFHCGIFLTNTTPARCHIHTCNRLPNRGDYGRALLEANGFPPLSLG